MKNKNVFKKIIKQVLSTILCLTLFLALLFFWILGTESGTKYFFLGFQTCFHHSFRVREIQGRLIDRVTMKDLSFKSRKIHIQAETLEIEFGILNLLKNNFKISHLNLKNTQVDFNLKILEMTTLSLHNFYFNPKKGQLQFTLSECTGSFQNQPFSGQGSLAFGEVYKFDANEIRNIHAEHQLHFNWAQYKLKLSSSATQANITLLPTNLKTPYFSSQIALQLDLAQGNQAVSGEGKLSFKPGVLQFPLPGNKHYRTSHQGGECQLKFNEKNSKLIFLFIENPANHIKGEATLPKLSLANFSQFCTSPTLSGEISGKFDDLTLCYHLMPALSRIKGKLDIQTKITGSLIAPKLAIHAEIPDAIFSIPKQHITVKNFNLTLSGQFPGRMELRNQASLGGENYSLKGYFDLGLPNPQNEFELKGENLRIYNTPNINLHASPDLKLQLKDRQLFVQGILTIPEANIILKDEFKNLMTSADVIYIDTPNSQTLMENFKINPQFKLIIKDKVHYKGNNLDARLEGKIRLERRQDKLLTALGRLTIVEGKYRLQNGLGHIHRGRLLYPPGTLLRDPVLDIRISRKPGAELDNKTEVGMYVQGTLKKPMVHLYSNDNLQSTEIMSRLGFSGTQVDGQDNQKHLLSQTALFLAGGMNPLFETLEIDEFGLKNKDFFKHSSKSTLGLATPSQLSDSVLVVGKSFGKRFYLQYLQGMNEPTSGVRLKYFLTPNLAIGVEKDTEGMGADLSFSMERN